MVPKQILIVDDEVSILEVLKSSLRKSSEAYHIETATDGYLALEKLHQQKFDLVITDYKMMGINGLELLEAIRSIRPDTRVILMTAYGNEALQAEASRLQAHRFLHKPLEISAFRKIVQESLLDVAINRPGVLILSENRYRQVAQILQRLQSDVGARCIFLIDASGQLITQTGDVQGFPIEAIASLLGGGIATITEAGRALDGDEDTINLAYREGRSINFYAINIGKHLLMVLMIERSAYSSKLGAVWYYAQSAARELSETLGKDDLQTMAPLLTQDSMEDLDKEFDKLLGLEDVGFPAPVESPTPQNSPAPAPPAAAAPAPKPAIHLDERTIPAPPITPSKPLFSFEEAVKRGLIPAQIARQATQLVEKGS